ncbi:MAG: OmpA family protein [Boseongicola sp.]
MFGSSFRVLSTLLFAAALTGCGAPSETSRSATVLQVTQPASLTALSRKFRADTPYIVNFGFDLDTLDDEARRELAAQADWILAHPHVRFRIYGHADKVGSQFYNIDLGLRRAITAVTYLVSLGIDERRLDVVVSYGEFAPVVNTDVRQRANRRVVTEVFAVITPYQDEAQDDDTVRSVSIADSFTEPAQESDPIGDSE